MIGIGWQWVGGGGRRRVGRVGQARRNPAGVIFEITIFSPIEGTGRGILTLHAPPFPPPPPSPPPPMGIAKCHTRVVAINGTDDP